MICEKCGAENPDGVKFCGKCGSPLEAETTVGAGKSNMGAGAVEAPEAETTLGAGKSNFSTVAAEAPEADKSAMGTATQETDDGSNIVNSNAIVTEQMTKAFNERQNFSGDLSADEKNKVKIEYLRSINKNPNVRDEQYDPNLVEVENDGKITDKNHVNDVMKEALLIWALIGGGVLLIIVLGVINMNIYIGIINTILFIIELLICGALFLGVIYNIVRFYSFVTSSRDTTFKLKSSLHILPIVVLLTISILLFGIEATIGMIVVLVIIGIVGLICLFAFGRK